MTPEYAHAMSEDSRSWERGFTSREQAIAAGRDEYPDEDGFVTGVVDPITPDRFFRLDASELLEQIADTAGDEMADLDGLEDDWVMGLRAVATRNADAVRDLEERLAKVFDEWCQFHGLTTDFYFVGDIQHHPLKEQG